MSDEHLAREIGQRLAELPVPEATEERIVAAARVAVAGGARGGSPHRRADGPRRWALGGRRTIVALAAAALLATGAAVAAIAPWDRDQAPLVPADRAAAERIVADPLLSRLAWITWQRGPDGGPPRIQSLEEQPSLVFPPGVDYEQAFQRLLDSLATDGALPPEARLGPPLPAGKVVRLPAGPSEGIALDLRSPRGYMLPGGLLPAGFAAAPDWTDEEDVSKITEAREQGLIVPLDAVIEPAKLQPCQVLDPDAPTPPCRLSPPLR